MAAFFNSRIFKSSLGLAAGFIVAFVGVFTSRVYLANNLDVDTLNTLFALSSLIALSVVLNVVIENAVIGDNVFIGTDNQFKSGVRIWNNKTIPSGTIRYDGDLE